MLPSITSNSTIPELLSVIKLSIERKGLNGKDYEEVERILICREEELRNEVRNLKKDVNKLKFERDLFEKLHGLAETENVSMEVELKRRKVECEELSERKDRLINEHKSLVYGKIRAEEMYRKEMEEVKKAETECLKMIVELKKKNKELNEKIVHYRHDFQQRVSNVEVIAAELLSKEVSDVRNGNHDYRNSYRSSMNVQSSSHSGGNHYSHRQNQDPFADNCDIDECKKKALIASPIAASEGPNIPVYIISSDDDESTSDDSAVTDKTNGVNLNSSLKEMPSVNNQMLSVETKDKNVMKDSYFPIVYKRRRKRSLVKGDEVNRSSVFGRQETQDMGEDNITPMKGHLESNHLHERSGKCSSDQPSSRKRTLTDLSDFNSSDSDEGFTADSDIDNTIAKHRKQAWKSAADLVSEFEKNYELCMKAVCVLYRRTITEENLTTDPSIPATPGLAHFISMGGKELAEFIIKRDSKLQLSSCVEEVKEKRPHVLECCRKLAIHYSEKLFEIYRKGEDRFFCCVCF